MAASLSALSVAEPFSYETGSCNVPLGSAYLNGMPDAGVVVLGMYLRRRSL